MHTMYKIEGTRKARFKSALARTGLTQKEWSEKQDVNYLHLYYVVLHDETDALLDKVDKFIEQIEAAA